MARAPHTSSSDELFQTPFFEAVVRPLTFALYRLLVVAVVRLGPRHAYALAGAIAWVIWVVSRRTRLTALRNLEICFGDEMSPARRREVGRRSLKHFLCTLFDVYLLPEYYKSGRWQEVLRCTPETAAQFRALADCGEGVAFHSAHFGSWEAAAGLGAKLGKPLKLIYRPLAHPEIDADFARYREASGCLPVTKTGALRALTRTLKDSGWLAILCDQNAGRRAAFLDFFGVAASAQIEHFKACKRFGARIAVGFMVRDGFDFRFHFEGLFEERVNPDADPEEESMRLGQWYLGLVEAIARKYPEQYLWAHRRFASRPHGTLSLYDGLGAPIEAARLKAQPAAPIAALKA